MKRFLAVLGCVIAFGAQATDWHWIGADGTYSLTSNTWQKDDGTKGVAIGADAIAVFDSDATVWWANDNGNQPIGGIKVLSGTVTMTSSYDVTRCLNFANPTNDIYIAPGATLVLAGHSPCGTNGEASATQVVRLVGGGTLRTTGSSHLGRAGDVNLLHQFIVGKDTILEINGTADGVKLGDALVVEEGGVAKMLKDNGIQNDTVIRVEKGGAFLASGKADVLGALTGEGTVVMSFVRLTLPAGKGPFVFGGVMTNAIAGITNPDAAGDDRYILLASTDAFAEVTVTAPNPTAARRFIRFKPGVGTFKIKSYSQQANEPLHLEDTGGNPVTVQTTFTEGTTCAVTGSGNVVLTHDNTRNYGGPVFSHTGWLSTAGPGTTYLGTLDAGTDVDLTDYAGFDIGTGSTLGFRQSVATTVTQLVTGGGQLYVGNSMTFENLRMSGDASALTAANDATVTLKNPAARLKTVSGYNTSDLVVDGGYLSGPTDDRIVTAFNQTIGSTLSVTNCDIQAGQFTPGAFTMTGGKLTLRNALAQIGTSSQIQSFVFNGGILQLGDGNVSWNSQLKTVTNNAPYRSVSVGENGLKIRVKNEGHYDLVSFGNILSACSGATQDGGLSIDGFGLIRVDATNWEVTGPISFDGGNITFAAPAFAASGPVTLGTVLLKYNSSVVNDIDLSVGTTALTGATTLYPRHVSTTSYGTFRLGALAREPGGVLFLWDQLDTSTFFDGTTYTNKPAFTTAAQLAHTAAGATKLPVFGFSSLSPAGRTTSRYHLVFLKSLADGSFEAVVETPWSEMVGATDLVVVDRSDEVKVTTDRTVAGLSVYGRNGPALTLDAGKTLTVGDGVNPAVVFLHNNHTSGRGTCQVKGAGTIDFGTSEGIVAANLRQSGISPAALDCVLKGTGGITFAGAQSGDTTAISIGGANVYSGGTHVNGTLLVVGNPSGFGTGPVQIGAAGLWGGEVQVNTTGTLNNDFTLGGYGITVGTGCLLFSQSGTLSGTVALQGDVGTRIGASFGMRGRLNGVVSGTGPLSVAGKGTVVLGAANTFTGGLRIEPDATVALSEGATPGVDTVTVSGTLRFENTTPMTVPWKIVGTGRIVLAGTGTVKLSNVAGFTGMIVTDGTGTYDLSGGDLTVSDFDVTGSFVNTGDPATLTLDGTRQVTFAGSAGGALSLVKKGEGVQYVRGNSTYTGATVLEAGTLVVGDPAVSEALPVTDDVLRLDATVGVTCEAGSDRVVKWADADSKDIIFSNVNYQALSTPNAATYKTNHINGLSTVYFDHSHIRYLAGGVPCSLRTYFGVVAHGHDATPFGILDGVFGQGGVDAGIRIYNGTSYSDPIALTDRVNGDAGSAFAKGTPHLFSRVYPGNMKWDSPALSDYSPHKRPMSGDICEIVVYGRVLGETERSLVEDYLMAKWGLKNLPDPAKYADVLPTGTDLTVASAATLDLNGNDQTLASLDLSGTLTNSVDRVATLTLSGVSFVRAGASFGAPNLDLVLSDDAVLDLGGGTFTIRRLTGRRVQVINGVLNETKPLLDFLLIIR